MKDNNYVYFVHSNIVIPDNNGYVLSETTYADNKFCSVIRRDNIIGCQFHPERSGEVGIKMYRNFLKGNNGK